MEGFEAIRGFPRVIGAIDGCHIQIPAPHQSYHPMSYLNRKRDYSVVLQAVCDHTLKFTDVYAGWPGSVHDARVFKNSEISNLHQQLFSGDTHILGDAAYPNQNWILTPFKDNGNLNAAEKKYNCIHSTTRQTIERAFGLLKGKWRRLKYLDVTKIENIPTIVTAVCTLHNICIENNEEKESDVDMSEYRDTTNDIHNAVQNDVSAKRNGLVAYFSAMF